MPGTLPTVESSINVIFGPAPRCTLAVVEICVGTCPASERIAERNIEKQPACAAPINSSGLVPFPSSKRDALVNSPSNAPDPRRMLPFPSTRLPFHTAEDSRNAIFHSLFARILLYEREYAPVDGMSNWYIRFFRIIIRDSGRQSGECHSSSAGTGEPSKRRIHCTHGPGHQFPPAARR